MPGSFDPYHKWLGIPPKDQPPNRYRLLAVDLFESDPDVIASAADQRMAHVRSFQTGRHAALSQQILNEIAAARVCLLNAEKKTAYDRQLREQLGLAGGREEPTAGSLEGLPEGSVPLRFDRVFQRRPWLRRRSTWQALAGILVAAALVGVILTAFWTEGDSDDSAGHGPKRKPGMELSKQAPPGTPGKSSFEKPKPDGSPPASADQKQAPARNGRAGPEQSEVSKASSGSANGAAEKTVPGLSKAVPIEIQGKGRPPGDVPETTPPKSPVPDDSAVAAAEKRLRQTLAKASAAELLEAGLADGQAPEERFVLLRMARDAAAASGDVAAAFRAVEEMAGRYEIDVLALKVEAFDALSETAGTPAALRALAERGLALVDQAVAEKKHDLATRLATESLRLSRASDDVNLIRRATRQVLQVQKLPER
jgi:uncharacterized protein YkwD